MRADAACDSYVICATPRTGSTLLCDLLAATGAAGDPDSFFMTNVDPHWAARWGLPPDDPALGRDHCAAYLDAAIAAGRGKTPVFGLRLMHENLGDLTGMIERVHPGLPSDRARFETVFGRVLFIHLARADKLAQAVSMVRAEQTGLWHAAPDGTELERLSPPREPHYDFAHIATRLDELAARDAAWTDWFKREGIVPLTIAYESLAEDPAGTLARVCHRLGVAAPSRDAVKPGVARLADAISRDWMDRFRADASNGR